MSGAQQSPRETWTGWNHRFESGRADEGYAVCTLCGTREDADEIIKPCPKGPVGKRVNELEAALRDCSQNCDYCAPIADKALGEDK